MRALRFTRRELDAECITDFGSWAGAQGWVEALRVGWKRKVGEIAERRGRFGTVGNAGPQVGGRVARRLER
jgi:hypothetical protein